MPRGGGLSSDVERAGGWGSCPLAPAAQASCRPRNAPLAALQKRRPVGPRRADGRYRAVRCVPPRVPCPVTAPRPGTSAQACFQSHSEPTPTANCARAVAMRFSLSCLAIPLLLVVALANRDPRADEDILPGGVAWVAPRDRGRSGTAQVHVLWRGDPGVTGAVRPLLRELLASCVLRPVMMLATPATVFRVRRRAACPASKLTHSLLPAASAHLSLPYYTACCLRCAISSCSGCMKLCRRRPASRRSPTRRPRQAARPLRVASVTRSTAARRRRRTRRARPRLRRRPSHSSAAWRPAHLRRRAGGGETRGAARGVLACRRSSAARPTYRAVGTACMPRLRLW
jgi:hypothetical protein